MIESVANWEEMYRLDPEKIKITTLKCLERDKPSKDGLFSEKLGFNIYGDRVTYICKCLGKTYETRKRGLICNVCKTEIKESFTEIFSRFGWIDIAPYFIINPMVYFHLKNLIPKIENVIFFEADMDLDGFVKVKKSKEYKNMGITAFKEKFKDVMDYYGSLSKGSKEKGSLAYTIYRDNPDVVFSSKIPVTNTIIRPAIISSNKRLTYQSTNDDYNKILGCAQNVLKTSKVNPIISLEKLKELQFSVNELFERVSSMLTKKKGIIRQNIVGYRSMFSARTVLVSDTEPKADMDSCVFSYRPIMELFKMEILSLLYKQKDSPLYGMTHSQALLYYKRACYNTNFDPLIKKIIEEKLINRDGGLSILINRNPSLSPGALLLLKIRKMYDDPNAKLIGVNLMILKFLCANFDGDVLNIFSIKEKNILENMKLVRPSSLAYYMGEINPYINLPKDSKISLNSFFNQGR